MKAYVTKKNIFLLIGIFFILVCGVFSVGYTPQTQKPHTAQDISKDKIDYLFVFSWSPTYCQEVDPQGKQAQCNKNKQYRFIVHGLWPQLHDNQQQGKYSNYCRSVEKNLEASIVEKYFYLMPSSELMHHEWIKHASCGNFTQQSYFQTIENLYQRFKVADIFKTVDTTQSMSLNALMTELTTQIPNISRKNIVIYCRKNYFGEVRICLNADYSLRHCRYNEIKAGGCRSSQGIIVPFKMNKTL